MKFFGKEFVFNGNEIFHRGNLTPGIIGAYSKTEVDQKITDAQGAKVYVSDTQPTGAAKGSVWI